MAGKATQESSVIKDAVLTALGALVFCGALFLLNQKIPLLKTLNIDIRDLQMIAFCIVLFAVFWPLLGKFLIQPYIALMEAREKLTTGADAYCNEQEVEAQRLTDLYEAHLFEARTAAMKEKLALLAKTKEEASKIQEEAQRQAQAELQNARSRILAQGAQLESQVAQEVEGLSTKVVEKILNSGGGVG